VVGGSREICEMVGNCGCMFMFKRLKRRTCPESARVYSSWHNIFYMLLIISLGFYYRMAFLYKH
jgi:hypothetical protein